MNQQTLNNATTVAQETFADMERIIERARAIALNLGVAHEAVIQNARVYENDFLFILASSADRLLWVSVRNNSSDREVENGWTAVLDVTSDGEIMRQETFVQPDNFEGTWVDCLNQQWSEMETQMQSRELQRLDLMLFVQVNAWWMTQMREAMDEATRFEIVFDMLRDFAESYLANFQDAVLNADEAEAAHQVLRLHANTALAIVNGLITIEVSTSETAADSGAETEATAGVLLSNATTDEIYDELNRRAALTSLDLPAELNEEIFLATPDAGVELEVFSLPLGEVESDLVEVE